MKLAELDTPSLAAFVRRSASSPDDLGRIADFLLGDTAPDWTTDVIITELETLIETAEDKLSPLLDMVGRLGRPRLLDAVSRLAADRATPAAVRSQCASALASWGRLDESLCVWQQLAAHPTEGGCALLEAMRHGATPARIEELLLTALEGAATGCGPDVADMLSRVEERRPAGAIVKNALERAAQQPWWHDARNCLQESGHGLRWLDSQEGSK